MWVEGTASWFWDPLKTEGGLRGGGPKDVADPHILKRAPQSHEGAKCELGSQS